MFHNCGAAMLFNKLPKGFHHLSTQVAGHGTVEPSLGLIHQENSLWVLKPFGKPTAALREISFYNKLNDTDDKVLVKLKQFVPKFEQVTKIQLNGEEKLFLQLENITYKMIEPCVMDIKIGKRTWDPLASKEKQKAEESKYLHCRTSLGICIPGFQVYSLESSQFMRFGKDYGKQLDEKTIIEALLLFLNGKRNCSLLIQPILTQLYKIQNWFKLQHCLKFYSSSILVAYDCVRLREIASELELDGNFSTCSITSTRAIESDCAKKSRKRNQQNLLSSSIKVKMIDFAHVFDADDKSSDTNYIFGLSSLIKILEDLSVK